MTVPDFQKFIGEERLYYENDGTNLFAFSLGQAARYYSFISIILERYRLCGAEYEVETRTFAKLLQAAGSKELDAADLAMIEKSRRLSALVHLEVESFYLFTKIFLDQLARFIENHFGQVRRMSLDSHDNLGKRFFSYASERNLIYSSDLLDNARRLKETICDYRDYEIAHSKNPRMLHATTFGGASGPLIARTPGYPKATDKLQTQSESPIELMREVDAYVVLIFRLIAENRAKSKFRLSDASE
ncbi:MAG TPA: hypothetical protein VK629_08675 [Steroidobacteraceae bacterium]|nr:hypothetical protein [Steroidobacteraceae bacterium]